MTKEVKAYRRKLRLLIQRKVEEIGSVHSIPTHLIWKYMYEELIPYAYKNKVGNKSVVSYLTTKDLIKMYRFLKEEKSTLDYDAMMEDLEHSGNIVRLDKETLEA